MPSFFAKVSERFHTPYVGIWVVVIFGSLMLAAYTLNAAFLAGLSAVLGNIVSLTLVSIAAIVFPYLNRTKTTFEQSPITYRILGVPVISILGVVSRDYSREHRVYVCIQ